ncbi:MAG: spore coat protein [Bacillota bacterium]|nr:spore coat protein [Bacillota bacterium]
MTGAFSEKELMHDLLATEKQTISGYSVGITETSCQNLRNTLVNNFKNAQDVQFKVFDAMKQKGWYATKDAPDSDVQKAKNEINQMSGSLK